MHTKPLPPLAALALGPVKMVRHAILEHRRRYQGRQPRLIELHPVVLAALSRAIPPPELVPAAHGIVYLDVPVVANSRNRAPLLIDWRGEPEEL